MLDGVVRFPPEFAARYRAKGYWEDLALRDTFDEAFVRSGDRVAVIDGDRSVTYGQLNARATRLALNLLDRGFPPARSRGRATTQRRRVRLSVFCPAEDRLRPDDGAADASLSRDEPVRRTVGRHGLRHAGQSKRFRFPRAGRDEFAVRTKRVKFGNRTRRRARGFSLARQN